ncbi:cell division septal protein [Serpentinimonas raichei]|uniref:Cell division protein FtsQ n=1 Tax=Serpentinimonas raichei TaxID=1458425 RepID=A0A060NQS9_9BURK|nr:cell division protein FtsQ/DivIB [Serpentinimonas raichei]BAO81853.1 cell division septal protein [Serpentinimonas raichei]
MNATQALPLDVRLMDGAAAALYALAAVLALAALGGWVVRQPVWSLSAIEVYGDVQNQRAAALQAHVAGRLQGNLWTLDLLQVQQLVQGAPWVRSAVVQRQFPNRLRITIEEHQPLAWWGQAGGTQLLNQYGEVFEAEPALGQGLNWSVLAGPSERATQVLELYRSVRPVFERNGWGIEQLSLDERGSWRIVLDDGARIEIGRGSPLELQQRVERFTQTVPALLQHYGGRPLETVDLRHPDGYALRIQGVSTLAELQLPPPQPGPSRPAQAPAAPTP